MNVDISSDDVEIDHSSMGSDSAHGVVWSILIDSEAMQQNTVGTLLANKKCMPILYRSLIILLLGYLVVAVPDDIGHQLVLLTCC